MKERNRVAQPMLRYALIGVILGFALSGVFYLVWGAFQPVGFFLWSVVAGGGGGLAGGRIGRSSVAAMAGAIVVRLFVFIAFGGVLF